MAESGVSVAQRSNTVCEEGSVVAAMAYVAWRQRNVYGNVWRRHRMALWRSGVTTWPSRVA